MSLQRGMMGIWVVAALGCLVYATAGAQYVQRGPKLVGAGAIGGMSGDCAVSLSADGNTAILGRSCDYGNTGAVWVFTRTGGVWSQEGSKLVGTNAEGPAWQGHSVSLSADGNTAIVGGLYDANETGAAWVFTRTGGVWSQQGDKIVGSGAVKNARQGTAVAISGDGNTAIVSGENDNDGAGAVWVFTRANGLWSQQGSKLVGTDADFSGQGASVSLSADGNTAIVGGIRDNFGVGAVWVFTRTNGVWSQQGSKLVGTGAAGNANQGISVSLSADGNTAIIGGGGDDNFTGAAWVFTRAGGVWSQQGSKLVGTNAEGSAYQGCSVSLSANGNTALVGGPYDASATGAVWVFTRTGGVWSQQGNKLSGTGASGFDGSSYVYEGEVVALSGDGNTAFVSGDGDSGNRGAAWMFTRTGGAWTQQGDKLVGTNAEGNAWQGTSVSLSADGSTAIVGGYYDANGTGAAWVFTRAGDVWSQQGNKLVGTGAVWSASQGLAVAISGDGNTAIVGGPNDDTAGAAWVFTRTNGVWTQQGNKLVGTYTEADGYVGSSVSLSSDGNTALVGGPSDGGEGGAWVFLRTNGAWAQQGDKLVGTGAVGGALQGSSVALSGDGNTAIVGGPYDDDAGAAWIFTRTNGVWSQQGNKLVGTGGEYAAQGWSVSLSADGNTALVGGCFDNSTAGAAWVFTRTNDVWNQQGSKLVGTGALGEARQGSSVALSGDGNNAIIGGGGDNDFVGAAWVFKRTDGVWSQQGNKLVGTGAVGSGGQGQSVSLSGDGTWALVGASSDNGGVGATWVFVNESTVPIQLGSFTGTLLSGNLVRLEWTTVSEINNYGFEVQRAEEKNGAFRSLPDGFFHGHGTTIIPQHYGFTDKAAPAGAAYYRLKQIDLNGTIHFSDAITVDVTNDAEKLPCPTEFSLRQNYPNPFNPSTTIKFELPTSSDVRLSVFDILGSEVSVLVNEKRDAGVYEAKFDGSNLASGVYFYHIQAGSFVQTRKLLLLH